MNVHHPYRYTRTDRSVMMLVELAGPLTVQEVIDLYVTGSRAPRSDLAAEDDEAAEVRDSMHRLAVLGDIECDAGMWHAARFR